jgi:hypothetical protein
MQQRPENQRLEQLRTQRTQPALPGASSTALVSEQSPAPPLAPVGAKKRLAVLWAGIQLGLLGFLLGLFYLALYPLMAFAPKANSALQQAFPGAFPWWRSLNWTILFPNLKQMILRISWLNPDLGQVNRTLCWLLVLAVGALLTLLAVRVLARVQRLRISITGRRLLFCLLLFFAILFSLLMLFAPLVNTVFTRDLLLSSLYGRMVAIYHANPYVVLPTTFAQDPFQQIVVAQQIVPYGPVWLDLSMLASLFAPNSVVSALLAFRLLGLVAHLVNCLLLWAILGRIKPEMRLSGVCLYAWNPLVLLLGIGAMHQEIVLGSFLLLAVFFFLYSSAMLGWVFALLAALTNPLYLLVLPLFLPIIVRNGRGESAGRRLVGWIAILLVTLLVVLLAYIPFWMNWGINGVFQNVLQGLWPTGAENSLDAALLHLPLSFSLPAPLLWILAPHHWGAIALLIIGCFLLFSLWLIDNLEMVLFFSSWVLLLALLLLPVYWPWFLIVPLLLTQAAGNRKTSTLVILLILGALLSYDYWQWQHVWVGLGLLCLCLPAVIWGWSLFFASTWEMMRDKGDSEEPVRGLRRLSRPPWFSRP